jgi:hypothetical protein
MGRFVTTRRRPARRKFLSRGATCGPAGPPGDVTVVTRSTQRYTYLFIASSYEF